MHSPLKLGLVLEPLFQHPQADHQVIWTLTQTCRCGSFCGTILQGLKYHCTEHFSALYNTKACHKGPFSHLLDKCCLHYTVWSLLRHVIIKTIILNIFYFYRVINALWVALKYFLKEGVSFHQWKWIVCLFVFNFSAHLNSTLFTIIFIFHWISLHLKTWTKNCGSNITGRKLHWLNVLHIVESRKTKLA